MTRFTLFVLLSTLIAGAQLVFTEQASSAAFTPGDLVVYRVGDGTSGSSGASAAIFLDEFTTGGTWVQPIAVPTTGANMMSASLTATSEGLISLSSDGNYLMFTGYRAAPNTANVAGTDASLIPRVVASIDASGNIATRNLGATTFSGNNIRSATSTNGSDVWVSGVASGTGIGGVFYLSFGGTGETQLAASPNDARQAAIYNSQLYISSDKGTNTFKGIDIIGSGLPTTGGQTVLRLSGLTDASDPSDFSFFMADLNPGVSGLDTMYISDDDKTAGGLFKYSLVNGNWVLTGSKAVGNNNKYRGLTGTVSGGTVTLYATRKDGAELASLVDTNGYNASISGSFNLIATAGANTAFRGVAFAPVPEPSAIIVFFSGIFTFLGYLRMRRKHNG
ncbi:MAG: hypothetical protein ABSA16_14655 [Thermoguttaceae bacterium]